MIRALIALLKKDFLIDSSYRAAFILNAVNVAATLLIYFFIDKLFGWRITPYLQEYGVNYFSYVFLSMAFFSYVGVGIGSFAQRINQEQTQGTLEALFMTPVSLATILLSFGIWNLTIATFDVLIYIFFGVFIFNIDFSKINVFSSAITIVLTISSFGSLGMISAGFCVLWKRGNPVGWLMNQMEGVLAGVYFPIAVLPPVFQLCAQFLPITHAIKALQLSVYQGASVFQLKSQLIILLGFTVILYPLSVYFFSWAIRRSRIKGTLAQY